MYITWFSFGVLVLDPDILVLVLRSNVLVLVQVSWSHHCHWGRHFSLDARSYSTTQSVITSVLLPGNNHCSLLRWTWCLQPSHFVAKSPPPVGAGGGYMFSGRPSVPPCVRPSVIHVVVLCFRDISSICWQIFDKLLSLVHLGTQMTWLRFWVERSKVKVTPSRRRRTALDATVEFNFF